jgi:hypothetical protein
MTLLGNWDNDDKNNGIFRVTLPDGRREEQRYLVADWGSTFGRMGPRGRFRYRSRWNLRDYRDQKVIEGVRGDDLLLHYKGSYPTIETAPLAHARWFSELVSAQAGAQVAGIRSGRCDPKRNRRFLRKAARENSGAPRRGRRVSAP